MDKEDQRIHQAKKACDQDSQLKVGSECLPAQIIHSAGQAQMCHATDTEKAPPNKSQQK